MADGEADPVRRQGLIQGAIDIVCGGRLSQIPLRDGVAVCLLVDPSQVVSAGDADTESDKID